jgi:hypothetical protein
MDQSQMLPAKKHPADEKLVPSNRKQRRALLGEGQVRRVRSGARTGTTPYFAAWMRDLAMHSVLSRMKTLAIAEAHTDPQTGGAYLLLYKGGIRNVLALTRMTDAEINAVPHLGPVRRRLIATDLNKRNVAHRWSA